MPPITRSHLATRALVAAATLLALATCFRSQTAAATSAAPTAPVWQPRCPATADIAALEHTMFELVNKDRQDPRYRAETGGAAPLLWWNAQLADVARCHSQDMMRHDYFSHSDGEDHDPGERLRRAGIAWTQAAENIALAASVQQAEALFMDEAPFQNNHRANILNSHFERIGIGIARAHDGRLYITQDFMAP